jgi:hypothetical protein
MASSANHDDSAGHKRTKTSRFRGVSRQDDKWGVCLRWNGCSHYLGSYPDEETAAVIYDHIGCCLQLQGFPVNLPEQTLHPPFVSAANIKADRLLQPRTVPPNPVVTVVGGNEFLSSQCNVDACVSDDDVPIFSRIPSTRKQHESQVFAQGSHESEDDVPLLFRME